MKTIIATASLFFVLGGQVSNAQEEKRRANEGDINRELFQLIRDLRTEVASLRKEVSELKERMKTGSRNERAETDRQRETDRPRVKDRPRTENPNTGDLRTDRAPVNAAVRKAKKVFAAYDKNKDAKVSFEEWLSMREGRMTDDRRRREQTAFQLADENRNESLSFDEFFQTRNRPARSEGRQSDRARESSRSKESLRKREVDRDQN